MARPMLSGMACYLRGLNGEQLVMCLVSAIAMYAVGYIVVQLFLSGIMFLLSLGLLAFFAMEVVDSVDSSVAATKYHTSI